MRKTIIVVGCVVLIFLIVSLGKDIFAKVAVEKAVGLVTGLELKMKSFKIGLIETSVGIQDLRLFNPKGYSDKVMVNMPEIYVDYSLLDLLKKKIHLGEMRIHLKEFTVVKNEKGELNLNSIKTVRAKKESEKEDEKKEKKDMDLQIDVLELKVGKVIYKDYSKGEPSIREFNINLNEKYQNITNPNVLVSLIVTKALMNTAISGLVDFDLGPLMESMPETIGKAKEAAAQMGMKASETAEDVLDAGKEMGGKVTDAAKDTMEKTTETFKKMLPSFGKEEE